MNRKESPPFRPSDSGSSSISKPALRNTKIDSLHVDLFGPRADNRD